MFFLLAGLVMTSRDNNPRDRELLVLRFQRNLALCCIALIPIFGWLIARYG
jgi:hypothetical protein